jgi:hypothetical protein
MVIQPGPSEAISFTDDTSPNLEREPDRKVSIHAQVVRTDNLGWYYVILSLYRDVSGELKSEKVLSNFPNLPKAKQDEIWVGLKDVRINVVDTLPFQAPFTKSITEFAQRDDALAILKDNARRGSDSAKQLLKFMTESVTKMLVRSAPAKQFMFTARLMRHPPGSLGWYMSQRHSARYSGSAFEMERDFEERIDSLSMEPFRSKDSWSVAKAVKWTSKSASVYFYAMDRLMKQGRYGHSIDHQYGLYQSLRPSHAFDRGDRQAVQWIEKSRQEILERLAPQAQIYVPNSLGRIHGEVSSEDSFFTQASDIAAGFARRHYEREGIVALTHKFEYVTFNGFRISQFDAEETMRKWRQDGYIGNRDKTIYICT